MDRRTFFKGAAAGAAALATPGSLLTAAPRLVSTRDVVFDTIFAPENVTREGHAIAFAVPVGQYAGRMIKEHRHTTMLLPGMLPAPEEFSVRKLSVEIRDREWVDVSNRWWDGEIRFVVGVGQGREIGGQLRDFADRNAQAVQQTDALPELAMIRLHEAFCVHLHFDHHFAVPMEVTVALHGVKLVPAVSA